MAEDTKNINIEEEEEDIITLEFDSYGLNCCHGVCLLVF